VSCEISIAGNDDVAVNLMDGSGPANGVTERRCFRVHRLVLDCSGVVHEHNRMTQPVKGNGTARAACDWKTPLFGVITETLLP
jgi:hypothetical protein